MTRRLGTQRTLRALCSRLKRFSIKNLVDQLFTMAAGFFADSVMQAQSYGVLLLCHSMQENPNRDNATRGLTRQAFVNW